MTDTMTQTFSLSLTRPIAASPEKVYAAWLTPEALVRFMGSPQRRHLTRAQTDPRIGGRFLLVMHDGTRDVDHTGTYLDLVPHARIVFTWESSYSRAADSIVTLDLVPDGATTRLTLTHERFETEAARDNHLSGWTIILDSLAATTL